MKYGVHRSTKDENNKRILGEQLTEELFDTSEDAHVWALEAGRTEKIDLKPGFSVELYTEKGKHTTVEIEGEKARKHATRLLKNDENVGKAVGIMINARYLYATAVTELEHVVGTLEVPLHEFTMDCLIQSSANESEKPFDEVDVYVNLQKVALPWLRRITERHLQEDRESLRQEHEEMEDQRRAMDVPIGVPIDTAVEPLLNRKRPLVLVGFTPAVRIILDHIVTSALVYKGDEHPHLMTVIRLCDKATKEGMHERLFRIGRADWKDCAKNSKSLDQATALIWEQLDAPPDLTVCDDLPHAYSGVTMSTHASRAANALKGAMQWCNDKGSGFVGAIPLPVEDPIDTSGTKWDRLKAVATVRPVTLFRKADGLEDGKVRIIVGRDAFTLDVDSKMLGGNIILPD